ncbi:uncharacterized protein A1O9_11049 [Exophiala aquamarina CBS 119918]|uniref:Heme oxygenase n=1 Tax=Exophiala aquamarina CBS 119918 TaxID=1182545 RepID=A0A072NZW6_9EURO|nr:uncharacterized protein A1O9_11049 [Exophiala aquamarina CBS 119918]KEF53141.1 hypothetical protein A1O9_11049 [Exophiala aquamarina CBS 119918]
MASQSTGEDETRPSLLIELQAATRAKHHALNLQVLNKLPLCMPPPSDSPILYARGMTVFGQIYYAFESHLKNSLENDELDETLRDIYHRIFLPRLLRAALLQRDMEIIKMRLGEQERQEIDDLAEQSMGFQRRILVSLSTKPHVLLAYAWTMYLALFNGGRWMRSQLFSAGPSFWLGRELPLSFWDFEDCDGTPSNGEDLKVAFKGGFARSAASLSDIQRKEIIDESKALLDLCLEMVRFLDESLSSSLGAETCSIINRNAGSSREKRNKTDTGSSGSLVGPACHYVTSTFQSVATSTATFWGRKEISSD